MLNTKYLTLDWNHRPDGRKFRFKHNKRVHSLYLQVRALEIAMWYR